MHSRANKNLICSVLCVDIVAHTRKPDAEQIRHKERFQAVVASALQAIAPHDRVILDTGDGAAVAFLNVPEDALMVALLVADGIASDAQAHPGDAIALRAAIHLGPVRLLPDPGGAYNMLGDALNAAQKIMDFAPPGRILVSRAYYDMVAPENPDIRRILSSVGSRTDANGRAHDVYLVGRNGQEAAWTWPRRCSAWVRTAWPVTPMGWVGLASAGVLVLMALTWLPRESSLEAVSPAPTPVIPPDYAGAAMPSPGVPAAAFPTPTAKETPLRQDAASSRATGKPAAAKGETQNGTAKSAPKACSEGARMLNQCG